MGRWGRRLVQNVEISWLFHCCAQRGSLPATQETERATVFQKCQIPRVSIPWAPPPLPVPNPSAPPTHLNRSQNISSFRIQGHCIFILIHFSFSALHSDASRKRQLFLTTLARACYPDSDLMFRFWGGGWRLRHQLSSRRVTDAEATQLAAVAVVR